MSDQQEAEIVTREFKRRGRRGIIQLLVDIQAKLARPSWYPRLEAVVWLVQRLGFEVKW